MFKRNAAQWLLVGIFACFGNAYAGEAIISSSAASITKDEYQKLIDVMFTGEQKSDIFANERKLRELLADVYVSKVLAGEAEKQGMDKTEQYKLRHEYDGERLLSQMVLDKAVADAKKPDFQAAAREQYLSNKEKFRTAERVHAEHILIATGNVRGEAEAKARAEEVYNKASKNAELFKKLAQEYSDDPSVKNNSGDLGFFERDKMVKPFADAAFGLKPGQISAPVKSQFGYHIIHLVEKRPAGQQSFDDVKAALMEQAQAEFEAGVRRQKVESIRAASDVKFNPDALRTFIEGNVEKTKK
ncbi:peptidyl-prolyl cis-trans isomerase [Pseudomonas alcaligenes]|uniref:peptidylprolyl isomerase n=1 Tax=Pseudomonas sp. RIT-PI-AD TaxID=3035294 RepID=UPI0021DAA7F2